MGGADKLGPLTGNTQHVGPSSYVGRTCRKLVGGVAGRPPLGHAVGIAGYRVEVVVRPGAPEAIGLGEGRTSGYEGGDGDFGVSGAD